MNVNSIWADEEYAFVVSRPKQTFVTNARRGRCIRTKKVSEYGKERKSAYVEFLELDTETGEAKQIDKWVDGRYQTVDNVVEIRARDVIDFWNDYENERRAMLAEQMERQRIANERRLELEREAEIRRREAQERREAEQRRQEEARREANQKTQDFITRFVERTGVPRTAITIAGHYDIIVNRLIVEEWLNTSNEGLEGIPIDSH